MEYSALSLKQPWATLLAHGRKTIEVRRWRTLFRGQLLIHAAGIDDERPEAWSHVPPELEGEAHRRQGVVGVGRLVECRVYRDRHSFVADQPRHLNDPDWFDPAGLFGLCFADLRPIPFREVKGYVRIFKVEFDDLEIPGAPAAVLGDVGTVVSGGGASFGRGPSLKGLTPPARQGEDRGAPGLLVSVRSAGEARAALAGGAAVIDVKDPDKGSLGRAAPVVLARIVAAVAGRQPVSAALGEMPSGEADLSGELASLAYVKWGLAGWREKMSQRETINQPWQEQFCRLRAQVESKSSCRVVLTAYADWRRAGAPPPMDVWRFAAKERPSVLLVDTWQKDGTTLLDWMSSSDLQQFRSRLRGLGVRLALAGSLGPTEIGKLLHIAPDWFAVRGAVCVGGKRTDRVEEALVRRLVEQISPTTSAG